MGTVYVRIGHDDDFVIAKLFNIKILTDTAAQSHDQGIELIVTVDLIGSGVWWE